MFSNILEALAELARAKVGLLDAIVLVDDTNQKEEFLNVYHRITAAENALERVLDECGRE